MSPAPAPPPVHVRPRVLAYVCYGVAAMFPVLFGLLALVLGTSEGPIRFRVIDRLSIFGLGVVLAGITLMFTRSRVEADVSGITVRNMVGRKYVPWQVVREVRMDRGAAWASLDLQDDDAVGLLAIQSGDGDGAVKAVLGLRALLQHSRRAPDDPPPS